MAMTMENKKTILVTGACGFVGSEIVRSLVKGGHSVTGIVYPGERARDINGVQFVTIDLSVPKEVEEKLPGTPFDVVIHCASQQPREGYPFDAYYRGNVAVLDVLLDWMRRRGVHRIITFSSVTVYGNVRGGLLTEESPIDPMSDYSLSKWVADQILKYNTPRGGLTGICFRMPSVFGAAQKGGLVHTYFELARKNDNFEIYSEGKLKRNLIYVDEVVQACEKALEHFNELRGYNLFLLGSSNSLTMGEVAAYIISRLGSSSSATPVIKPAPVNSDWDLCLKKARDKMGFVPKTIEEGIDRYIEQKKREAY